MQDAIDSSHREPLLLRIADVIAWMLEAVERADAPAFERQSRDEVPPDEARRSGHNGVPHAALRIQTPSPGPFGYLLAYGSITGASSARPASTRNPSSWLWQSAPHDASRS